jgi:putative transposase
VPKPGRDLSVRIAWWQQFAAITAPDQVWASDITYIATLEGWLYLAVILDLFSRRVVGWKLGQTLESELVITALRNALVLRQPQRACTFTPIEAASTAAKRCASR